MSGSNREEAVRPLVEKCGGKLVGFYGMIGEDYHAAIIVEFESLPNYMGTVLSGVLGGAIADWNTIQLYTADDLVAATEVYRANQGSYSPPPSG